MSDAITDIAEHRDDEEATGSVVTQDTRVLILEGLAFRRKIFTGDDGLSAFKGVNISTCLIEGAPAYRNILPERASSPSLWKHRSALPRSAVAFASMVNGICAVVIDPSTTVMMNSAFLFIPDESCQDFPFDILIRSTLFQWYVAFFEWSGTLLDHRTHVYTGTIKRLPWSPSLLNKADELRDLRQQYLQAHEAASQRPAAVEHILATIPTETFQERFDRDQTLRVRLNINGAPLENSSKVYYGTGIFDFIEVSDALIARMLSAVILARQETLTAGHVMSLQIAESGSEEAFFAALAALEADERKAVLEKLDAIVYDAFELNDEARRLIQEDVTRDPTLKHLDPRPPYTARTIRGVRASLTSAGRYAAVAERPRKQLQRIPGTASRPTVKRRSRQQELFVLDATT